jgi:hypothetical protein
MNYNLKRRMKCHIFRPVIFTPIPMIVVTFGRLMGIICQKKNCRLAVASKRERSCPDDEANGNFAILRTQLDGYLAALFP